MTSIGTLTKPIINIFWKGLLLSLFILIMLHNDSRSEQKHSKVFEKLFTKFLFYLGSNDFTRAGKILLPTTHETQS